MPLHVVSCIILSNEYSKAEAKFLDQNMKVIDREIKTELFAKLTNTRQSSGATSCHPYHCK